MENRGKQRAGDIIGCRVKQPHRSKGGLIGFGSLLCLFSARGLA